MSSNQLGSIEVAVESEGTDEAADDVSDVGEQVSGGGGGGGDGGGGLGRAIAGGIVGGLVASLAKPLLKVLDPILKVLQAFLAPVAAMLMRALAPVLRELLLLLPDWMDFLRNSDVLQGILEFIRSLPQRIKAFLDDPLGSIEGALDTTFTTLKDVLRNSIKRGIESVNLSKLVGLDRGMERARQTEPFTVNARSGNETFRVDPNATSRSNVVLKGDLSDLWKVSERDNSVNNP